MQLNKKSCFDYAFGVRAWQQVSSLKCIEQNWQFHTLFAFIRSMILSFFLTTTLTHHSFLPKTNLRPSLGVHGDLWKP